MHPRIVSNVDWDALPWGDRAHAVGRPRFVPFRLAIIVQALRLWWANRDPRSQLVLDCGGPEAILCGLLRSLWRPRGSALAFNVLLYPWRGWKRWVMRRALGGFDAVAVYSRQQVVNCTRELILPRTRFLHLPYKANHSQWPAEPRLCGNGGYIFAGGNSERDYRTLFDAVRGTGIPVIVSCTRSEALAGLDVPTNVSIVRAIEPHFGRLMAASRFVVIPIVPALLRGAGEASFLNALWHRRPVIVADTVSAPDYIRPNVGVVVTPGDVLALKTAIVELWNDPLRCRRMGLAGRRLVERHYTHERWRNRLFALADDLFHCRTSLRIIHAPAPPTAMFAIHTAGNGGTLPSRDKLEPQSSNG